MAHLFNNAVVPALKLKLIKTALHGQVSPTVQYSKAMQMAAALPRFPTVVLQPA